MTTTNTSATEVSFRVRPLGFGREADEITEEDGDDLPLLGLRNGRVERGRTATAEPEAVGVLLTAVRADLH